MKAAVVTGPNQTPTYQDFDDPAPQEGFTVVEVTAAAVSTVTRARAAGTHYSASGGFPFVIGIDGVGRTPGGQRVGFLLPQAPFGAMAERTLVRDALLLPVPDGLGDVAAAAVINPGQSPIAALRVRAAMSAGETVLVNGATGITGQVAVQVAKHLGAGRVIATGRDADALAALTTMGADHTIDLSAGESAVAEQIEAHVTDGGIDVVLDYLSGPPAETVLAAIARSHQGATSVRYVIAGTAAGAGTAVSTSALGAAPITLMGSGIGAVAPPDIVRGAAEALQIAGTLGLRIPVDEMPLESIAQVWTADHGRRRTVLTVSSAPSGSR